MENIGISENSGNQDLQRNDTLNSDIITELQNCHYDGQMTDTTDLTSVFIEYDDEHVDPKVNKDTPKNTQLDNFGTG